MPESFRALLKSCAMFTGKSAVIFDLDGTLIDSLSVWSHVDELLIEALGSPPLPKEFLAGFREQSLERHRSDENPYVGFCADLGAKVGSTLSGKDIHALRYRISRQVLKTDVLPKPGAVELVHALRAARKRLAIATTTGRPNIDIYADQNKALAPLAFRQSFEFILTKEDVSRIKPDPEVYELAVKRLGLLKEQCLVIEDSPAGIIAAKAAGLSIIAVPDKKYSGASQGVQARADACFASLPDLMPYVLR